MGEGRQKGGRDNLNYITLRYINLKFMVDNCPIDIVMFIILLLFIITDYLWSLTVIIIVVYLMLFVYVLLKGVHGGHLAEKFLKKYCSYPELLRLPRRLAIARFILKTRFLTFKCL